MVLRKGTVYVQHTCRYSVEYVTSHKQKKTYPSKSNVLVCHINFRNKKLTVLKKSSAWYEKKLTQALSIPLLQTSTHIF